MAEAVRRGRGRRRLWIGGTALILLLLVAVAGVSWHYSNDVLQPDHSGDPYDIEVVAVGPGTVELERTEATARPGIYGIEWPEGSAIIEGPLEPATGADTGSTVTRQLSEVEGDLRPGEQVRLDAFVFQGDPSSRGLPFRDVEIEGELGPMPAWQIGPDRNPRWAIVVHGINSSRRVALPIAPTLREAGLTVLSISYRNDIGAPPSPDGHHHMGLTEWRDVEAAARFAVERGARELVMVGSSMGGALVSQFIQLSPQAEHAAAMILDAPALDWPATISFGARQMGLPEFAAKPVLWMIGLRIDADWDRLDALAHADDLRLPTLLFHGLEDKRVPIESSDAFAAALPDSVTYHRVPEAGHILAWNVDPDLHERRVSRFIGEALDDRG